MPFPDLKGSITFRGTNLNSLTRTNTGGQTVITGYQVDALDPTGVEIRQFTEPLALVDGIDTGGAWLGARQLTLRGTVYGSSRSDAASKIDALEALFLIDSGTMGFYDLTYATMAGSTKTYSCRPNGIRYAADKSKHGGVDAMPMAIEYSVTFFIKSPN